MQNGFKYFLIMLIICGCASDIEIQKIREKDLEIRRTRKAQWAKDDKESARQLYEYKIRTNP